MTPRAAMMQRIALLQSEQGRNSGPAFIFDAADRDWLGIAIAICLLIPWTLRRAARCGERFR
jgi:hypothetical protein